jgi:hypothetical protein
MESIWSDFQIYLFYCIQNHIRVLDFSFKVSWLVASDWVCI